MTAMLSGLSLTSSCCRDCRFPLARLAVECSWASPGEFVQCKGGNANMRILCVDHGAAREVDVGSAIQRSYHDKVQRLPGRRRLCPSHSKQAALCCVRWPQEMRVHPLRIAACPPIARNANKLEIHHPRKKVSRTWSFPICSVVVVKLLESAKIRIVVVNVLLESRIANTTNRLPVSTRQMAHLPPAVHVIAVASRNSRRKQRGEHEMLHGG
jgi:hypothetical protein